MRLNRIAAVISLALAAATSANAAVRLAAETPLAGTVATKGTVQIAGGPKSGSIQSGSLLGPLYNSNGFEAFANGNLSGQNGFAADAATPVYTVTAGAGVGGTKGVVVGAPTSTNWNYPTLNYIPAAGELVSVSADISASAPSTTNPFGYLIDAYGNAPRIGRVGLVYNAGSILPAVTFNNAGTVGTFLLGNTPLTPGTFYNFEMRFNFATKTFDVYSGGSPLATNLAFAGTAAVNLTQTTFGDGDLQVSGAAGAANTGIFDNYVVTVIAAPEPTTLGALAGVGAIFARRRKA